MAIAHQVTPWPPRVGRATVTLTIADPEGKPVTGAKVGLEGDMSHPGMSPEFGDTREIGPGRYQGMLNFTMAGDWVVLLHVTMPGGQALERQIDIKGVGAN